MTANSGRFKKGIVPWNKGMKDFRPSPATEFDGSMFGPEHFSWRGGIQRMKNDCTHRWTGPNKRVRNPRAVYEENFGPIPKGYVIFHLDGDRHNDSPENLEAISRGEMMKRNANNRRK